MQEKSKYARVHDDIMRKIESGQWRPGDRLPAETMLAKTARVSLGTVQRSLRMLEEQGVIVRRHGSGTYVASIVPTQSEVFNHFFVAEDKPGTEPSPLPLYIKVIDISLFSKPGPWSRFLRSTGDVIRVQRIINVNLEFQIYTEMFLHKTQFAHLLDMPKHKLDGVAFLRTMYSGRQLPPRRFVYEMWLAPPPARAAARIQIDKNTPCMHWETMAYGHRDAPVFYSVAFVPPTTRRLRVEVLRDTSVDKSHYSAESERANRQQLQAVS